MLPEKTANSDQWELVEDDSKSEPNEPGNKQEESVETNRAAYRTDLRSYVDRRQSTDRRKTIRFEDDRRQYIRRTEDRAWRLS